MVTWLASTDSADVTGQVIESSGLVLAIAEGWHRGPSTEPVRSPGEVGPRVRELLRRRPPPHALQRGELTHGDAWIVDAVRTPRGKGRPDGGLHDVHPQELLAQCLRALAGRTGFDPTDVDDVVAGNGILCGDHGDASVAWPSCSPAGPRPCPA